MQVLPEFLKFQVSLRHSVDKLYQKVISAPVEGERSRQRVRNDDDNGQTFEYRYFVDKHIWYKGETSTLFSEWSKTFKDSSKYRHYIDGRNTLSPKINEPSALLCFDEARGLLDNSGTPKEPEMRFLALCRALRQQTKVKKRWTQQRR